MSQEHTKYVVDAKMENLEYLVVNIETFGNDFALCFRIMNHLSMLLRIIYPLMPKTLLKVLGMVFLTNNIKIFYFSFIIYQRYFQVELFALFDDSDLNSFLRSSEFEFSLHEHTQFVSKSEIL